MLTDFESIESVMGDSLDNKKLPYDVAETMHTCLRGAMVAHQTSNLGVAGSIPAVSMFFEGYIFYQIEEQRQIEMFWLIISLIDLHRKSQVTILFFSPSIIRSSIIAPG